MLYETWNYRYIPIFKEEITDENPNESLMKISIKEFQHEAIYPRDLRAKLENYLKGCPNVTATSYKRCNAYTNEITLDLSYYTDGEVLFDNYLFSYILQEDFAIPTIWLSKIREKNFLLDTFSIDYEKIRNEMIDVFQMSEQTFNEIPIIKEVLAVSS